jgi:hypothetical protein
MPRNAEILCVERREHDNPSSPIIAVSGVYLGETWKMALSEAAALERAGAVRFYVRFEGKPRLIDLNKRFAKSASNQAANDNDILDLATRPT